jgi:hypothetical protein
MPWQTRAAGQEQPRPARRWTRRETACCAGYFWTLGRGACLECSLAKLEGGTTAQSRRPSRFQYWTFCAIASRIMQRKSHIRHASLASCRAWTCNRWQLAADEPWFRTRFPGHCAAGVAETWWAVNRALPQASPQRLAPGFLLPSRSPRDNAQASPELRDSLRAVNARSAGGAS